MGRVFNWDQIGKAALKWFSTPWKPTATALTLLVVWYLRPVLESQAIAFRNALLNPNSEPDPWARWLAVVAHRTFFVEFFTVGEIVLLGAMVVIVTNFIFYVWGKLAKGMPKRADQRTSGGTRKTRRAITRLPNVTNTPDGDAA